MASGDRSPRTSSSRPKTIDISRSPPRSAVRFFHAMLRGSGPTRFRSRRSRMMASVEPMYVLPRTSCLLIETVLQQSPQCKTEGRRFDVELLSQSFISIAKNFVRMLLQILKHPLLQGSGGVAASRNIRYLHTFTLRRLKTSCNVYESADLLVVLHAVRLDAGRDVDAPGANAAASPRRRSPASRPPASHTRHRACDSGRDAPVEALTGAAERRRPWPGPASRPGRCRSRYGRARPRRCRRPRRARP